MTGPLPEEGPPIMSSGADQPPMRTGVSRWIWVALMVLAAVIVAGLAGLLAHAGGANIPAAILTGGGAFAGAMLLLLAVAHYAGGD